MLSRRFRENSGSGLRGTRTCSFSCSKAVSIFSCRDRRVESSASSARIRCRLLVLTVLVADEPDEVKVVKRALLAHLDMDPRITLGVFCDQILPPPENLDSEEKYLRDRLRALVLSFLAEDAKEAITKNLANHTQGARDAERVLMDGLNAVGAFSDWF